MVPLGCAFCVWPVEVVFHVLQLVLHPSATMQGVGHDVALAMAQCHSAYATAIALATWVWFYGMPLPSVFGISLA